MRKAIAALLFCFGLFIHSSAQNTGLKGKIVDTLEKKNLSNAVVSLLNRKDSTLVGFTRSDKNGEFLIGNTSAGKYILLITYPKMADFADEFEIGQNQLIEIGNIAMTHKDVLLQEVIVRGTNAIRIKGDTTEFLADSFKVREGATVEELLKKMPGFQVNAKGEITAQGQRVEKVLVDGEEFFGDDPTMATQNISAKAVDKVQVFDSKTEQQQLTGISGGNEGKTVNIKLKEDSKKGAFGKINAGSDFKDYFDSKALYNKFVGKKKLSLYGTKSNVTTGSLDWEDRQKLGLEEDWEYDEIGGYYFSEGGADEFSDWNFRGLPNSYTAGALYNNKWNSDKQGINTSYRYNRLGTENIGSTFNQNILQNDINYRNVFTNTNGLNQQHAVNGKYEWKIDSLATLKFTTAGIYKTSDNFTNTNSEYLNRNREFINANEQQRDHSTERIQSDNVLNYKQLFKKKNRTLLATLRYGITTDDHSGTLKSQTQFYRNGVIDSVGVLDQYKTFDGESKTFGSKITFSEPLTDKWNIVLDYSFNKNNSESYRNTFNKDLTGKYGIFDPVFSNNFDMVANSHSSTAILRFIDKKVKLALGSGASNVKLKLHDLDNNSLNTYNFFRVTPQAQFNYAFKQQTSLTFNYRGTTRQPSINQLQPLRDNSDNLNVFVGNPDLKVGFNHNINVFFNQYKVLSGSSMWLSASYNVTNNAITNFTTIDTVRGIQIYTPVNVNGNRNFYFWGNWHKGRGEKKVNYGMQLDGNGGRNINFINQKGIVSKNITSYSSMTFSVSASYDQTEKVSFSVRPRLGYNTSKSSLQPQLNNNYFTYGGHFNGFKMLPGKLELSTDINFDLREKLPQFPDNTNLIIWNANLARKVFKDKSGKIILVANDILDQNRGFNMIINSNFIQEERYSRLSRYFLLKFEWSFNKMPGSK